MIAPIGVCARCLCTELTPCIVNGEPCAWATESEDLCTACLTPEEAAELVEGAILLEDDEEPDAAAHLRELERAAERRERRAVILEPDRVARRTRQVVETLTDLTDPLAHGFLVYEYRDRTEVQWYLREDLANILLSAAQEAECEGVRELILDARAKVLAETGKVPIYVVGYDELALEFAERDTVKAPPPIAAGDA